jgi:hypothetical protein
MARTRTQIRQLIVVQLGLPFVEGTTNPGAGSVTTLVDTPDLSQFRDDALIGSWIYVSDGDDADINLRDLQIIDSVQSTGTLTFIPEIAAEAGIRGRTYEILPFSATAIHQSIENSLDQLYDMGLLVREFTFRGIVVGSPIYNANFELWSTTATVDGWGGDGAGVTQVRERDSGHIAGSETSMKLVSNSGSTEGQLALSDPWKRYLWDMKGHSINFYCWVKSDYASHARIGINNGSSITYSDYHSGDGDWNLLKVEYASAVSDTDLFPCLAVANTNAAYFADCWVQGGGDITEYPWPIVLAPDGPNAMALVGQGVNNTDAVGSMKQLGRRQTINNWQYILDHTYSFPSATSVQRGTLILPQGLPQGDRMLMQCTGPFTLPTSDQEAVEVTLPESLMLAKMAARSLLERRLLQLPLSTRRVYEDMMQRLASDVGALSSGHGQSSDVISFGPVMR